VLPCLDEASALTWVLERVPRGVRPIVVDNGSTDGSPALAQTLGALVIRCDQRGYGSACHAGLLAADAELVAFCDCDGSIDPAIIAPMARRVTRSRADDGLDMIVGERRPTARGAWPVHARLANRYLSWRVGQRTGTRLRDIGPVRVARRDDLLALGLTDRRSGYPLETVLRAGAAGWRMAGHPVDYYPRAGRSKVTGTWRGTVHAVRDMSAALAR
jgi:glycosyltransferase involved in cell wall biosynthesis